MKNFVIIFSLFFIYFLPARAQQKDYAFKNVTIREGLSQNSVVDVEQDATGFIWFARQDGLNRFDGSEFLVFPNFFDDITTPEHTQLGKLAAFGNELWMVTRGGSLEVLNFLTHKTKKISQLGAEPVEIPPVSDLFFDKEGNLWIGTLEDGLYFYNSKENKVKIYGEPVLSDKRIRTVYQDHAGNLWVLTKSGVNKINSNGTTHYMENTNTHVMTKDHQGTTQ
jgi:ligand-binding sensor domain-containing protein